ncbi:50S ribosomal protein L11 [Candidatus Sneabacter namystus]|uniref:Large ribosomal subunit protein uL11 n=1 Tax=Candidatus Sneabacter namystus TaxID=2601646 RepID=A0A5C0UIX0_9RICK|nr:50S ribosomal protein L11 [Candidatus Sneabacter namystus]QEK39739.1 50S ribosomal protein L11 [Candidatus Sneabacter namystus]
MSKKATRAVSAYIKLTIKAKSASPAPPVGPALGQHGLNIMEFCKGFNDKTKDMSADMPVPVIIEVYKDRTFSFLIKTPPVSYLLMNAAGISKGSAEVGRKDPVGCVSRDQCVEIAKQKMEDLNAHDIDQAVKIVEGSARSIGIVVK